MDRNHNILLAKKYMVESIYRSANIEGIAMTFPETQAIRKMNERESLSLS